MFRTVEKNMEVFPWEPMTEKDRIFVMSDLF